MPDLISILIEKLVPGGEGLARHEGRVVFVPGVLPGEEVIAEITQAKKDFARARVVEITKASPDRVSPPCELAGICGGCDWLHIDPAAQAGFKIEIARDSLRRMGGFDLPALEIETGAPLGYRNRVQVHADGSGAVGFQGRKANDFVPVGKCPISHPALAPLFAEGTRPGRSGRFLAFGHSHPDGSHRLARADENPDAEISVRVLDRDIVFPVRGFFQSNLEMTERLVPFVLDGMAGVPGITPANAGTALDLYAGVGLFGAFLKDRFACVVCVEFNRHALKHARVNVGERGVFFAEPLEQVVGMMIRPRRPHPAARPKGLMPSAPDRDPLEGEPPSAAVVDPPREGLDKGVRKWLVEKPIPRLVYVSCNPVTLARDLKDLLAGPYALEEMRLFDFYPQTSHIEAAAVLRVK